MKNNKTTLTNVLICILIIGLGFYLGSLFSGSTQDSGSSNTGVNSVVTGETHRMDSLSTVITAKDSMIINLNKKLGELADSKDKEIKKIRNLGAKESKDWLENKLKEIDNIDSLQFFSSDSSVIIGINGIRTINGLLVDRDYLKKQVEYSDSIMTVQREQLVLKDSLFETIKIREQKELQYYDEKTGTLETELSKEKKQKKTWKIGTGVGILGGVIIGLLL